MRNGDAGGACRLGCLRTTGQAETLRPLNLFVRLEAGDGRLGGALFY